MLIPPGGYVQAAMVHAFVDLSERDGSTLFNGDITGLDFNRTWIPPGESSPSPDEFPETEENFVIHPNSDQIEYVISGRGRAVYPDGSYPLRPGTAAFHSAGQPHRFENDLDEPLVFLVITAVGDKDASDRIPYTGRD